MHECVSAYVYMCVCVCMLIQMETTSFTHTHQSEKVPERTQVRARGWELGILTFWPVAGFAPAQRQR